jgi:type IV secretory pathway TrbD component
MIVWTGWGIVALPLFALGALGGTSIGVALGLGEGDMTTGTETNIGTAFGLALAGVAVWFLGRWMNRPQDGFDPRTRRLVQVRNRHRLFFVPIQYLGPLGGVGAVVAAVQALTAA